MNRNPLVEFGNSKVQFIGDQHFGRSFKAGTPTSKLGARERLIEEEFIRLLNVECDYVVLVGDLFDKFSVNNEILFKVYSILKEAPNKTIIIPGNHDLAKDKSKVSSYYILKSMLEGVNNIIMIDRNTTIDINDSWCFILDCYNPFYKTEKSEYDIPVDKNIVYIGHWDDIRFEDGYFPDRDISAKSRFIYSGHIHTPVSLNWENTPIYYIGSMQPYSFGEDPSGEFYVYIDYELLESWGNDLGRARYKDRFDSLKNKHIKIDCPIGYSYPYSIDCLSISYNPIKNTVEEERERPSLTSYDFKSVYLKTLRELDIDSNVIEQVESYFNGSTESIDV